MTERAAGESATVLRTARLELPNGASAEKPDACACPSDWMQQAACRPQTNRAFWSVQFARGAGRRYEIFVG